MAACARQRLDRTSQAGFTLVELLIALTLVGLISVMLFGGLRFAARSWEAVATAAAEREEIASTQNFLRERLTMISAPGRELGQQPVGLPTLEGDHDRLNFTAPWLSALSVGGLYMFTLWLETAEPGALMLAWRPVRPVAEATGAFAELEGERILLDGVDDLKISYLGTSEAGSQPVWASEWRSEGAPPQLLRIELKFADSDRVWPALAIRPRR